MHEKFVPAIDGRISTSMWIIPAAHEDYTCIKRPTTPYPPIQKPSMNFIASLGRYAQVVRQGDDISDTIALRPLARRELPPVGP